MARKRKLESRSKDPNKPPKKHQQLQVFEDPKYPEEEEYEEIEQEYEEVEEEEEDDDDDEEEEEEDEEEDDEEEDDDQEGALKSSAAANRVKRKVETSASGRAGDIDDEEEIQKLLEPFSKEHLMNLLCEAADKHPDVADRIRKVADEDPVHRKIFVHGLGWDTNAETLKNAFIEYGEIEECKAVCDKVSGKSKGYGFIVFKNRGGARRALKVPQKKIGNRVTACQLASLGPAPTPGAGASAAAQSAQLQTPTSEYTQRKIYVSNVGAELDPQKLLTFFSKYGEIEDGPLGMDKHTGKPKGFCLFVYKSVESAKKALEEPHKNFEGNILHCQRAIDGPKSGKSQQHNHHHHNHSQNPKQHGAQFQRNENAGFVGGSAAGTGHLMAPGGAGTGFNQGAAAVQALNPALGQALTALLATQGAGLGLTNLFGTMGAGTAVTPGIAGGGHGMQGAYVNQANMSPGMMGAYGNQGGVPGGYLNQQIGQGGPGRGQQGAGQYGGASAYMGN
ncbi:UBP1-associated protein 2A [Cannabis sativa]|uniref:UBP1-associated protein 2A n=1 Tax=Cannabis sativa TaxID=3483 RepID=UPI0029C9F0D5|nr:UBP1-associated protein 2A [Cannabis sativa]XP_030496809.2 UBP1-associated protein 2A [Cannabis sativa]XP_060970081.1 UBP1-associated protein 2A [Cannabis sativa]